MNGMLAITEERRARVVAGHDVDDDVDQYWMGQLAEAAMAYLWNDWDPEFAAAMWPFAPADFNPGDRREALAKAGAMCAAEIDRLTAQRSILAGAEVGV